MALRALDQLGKSCPALMDALSQFSGVNLHVQPQPDDGYHERDYGWHSSIEIGFERSDDGEPADFVVGHGRVTGVDAFGVPAVKLCASTPHEVIFVDQAFSFLAK